MLSDLREQFGEIVGGEGGLGVGVLFVRHESVSCRDNM